MATSHSSLPCRDAHSTPRSGCSRSGYCCTSLCLLILAIPGCSGCQKLATEPEKSQLADETPPPLLDPAIVEPTPVVEKKVPATPADPAVNGDQTVQAVAATQSRKNSPHVGRGTANTDVNGQQPTSSAATPPRLTAAEALAVAKGLQERSSRASQRGDFGAAFDLSSRAWESVSEFPDDPQCSELASQIELELDVLGPKANSRFSNAGDLSSRRLIDK